MKQFIFDKNENGIPKDILLVIKKVIVNHDVPTSLYDTPAVSNIRIISVDKEAKSCSCQAHLNYTKNNRTAKPIIFNAQKTQMGKSMWKFYCRTYGKKENL